MRSSWLLASTVVLALVAPAASAFDLGVGRLMPNFSGLISLATPWTEGSNPAASSSTPASRATDVVAPTTPAPSAGTTTIDAAVPRVDDGDSAASEAAMRPGGNANTRHPRRARPSGWRGLLPGGIH